MFRYHCKGCDHKGPVEELACVNCHKPTVSYGLIANTKNFKLECEPCGIEQTPWCPQCNRTRITLPMIYLEDTASDWTTWAYAFGALVLIIMLAKQFLG